MSDFPIGDPHCPDCQGTGRYQGLGAAEPCKTCGEKEGGNASLEDALEYGDLVEEMFPGELKDGEEDPIQATVDAAPDLSGLKWDDASGWKREDLPLGPKSLEEVDKFFSEFWQNRGKMAQKEGNLQAEDFYGPSV